MDVMQSCRCCLRCPPDKDLMTPYTYLGKTEIYSNMLKECFDLHLTLGDGECGICEVCVGRLRDASDFKQQVQRSQAKLLGQLQETVHVKVEPTVKSEPDDDSMGQEPSLEACHSRVKLETPDEDDAMIEDNLLSERVMDSDRESTPEGVQVTEKLSEKSKRSYKKAYDNFMTWKSENNESSLSERTLQAYFEYLHVNFKFKPSTLWVEFCKLKSTISIYHQTDISKYSKLCAWLKKAHEGFTKKQAKTFSSDDLERFINDAPDRDFLLIKTERKMIPESSSMKDTNSSSSESETPDIIDEKAVDNLPQKSKETYLKAYDNFLQWRSSKSLKSYSESVLLEYFQELSTRNRPPTLTTIYSMLKSTIRTKHNIHIDKYKELKTFMKRVSKGPKRKKTKILTPENIDTFLKEAPDSTFLLMKVVLIFGLNGACRSKDLLTITVDNVRTHSDDVLSVTLPDKTKKERTFYIRGEHKKVVEKYQALRPATSSNRFFIQYRSGKCVNQVIGKNKFSMIPRDIAKFLNLENPELYTGHCIRQTSASLLLESMESAGHKGESMNDQANSTRFFNSIRTVPGNPDQDDQQNKMN